MRGEIHSQLDGESETTLLGAALDEEERFYALWVSYHLAQSLAIYDRGRLTQKRAVSRGITPYVRDILPEARGPREEIAFEHITSISACCLPKSLSVFRVSDSGLLVEVLSFPKSRPGRYEPTPATSRALREERALRARKQAEAISEEPTTEFEF